MTVIIFKMQKLKGFFALLATGLIFGSFGIWVRFLSQDLTAFQQIAFRNSLAFLFTILLSIILRQSFSIRNAPKKFLLLFGVSFGLGSVFYTLSILNGSISSAIFAFYVGSLVVSFIIGHTLFKEKITLMKIAALCLVTIGIVIYVYPFSSKGNVLGLLFGFLSGSLDTIANSCRKYFHGKVNRLTLVLIQVLSGVGIAGVLILFSQQASLPNLTLFSWLIGGIFGLLLASISYLLLVGFQNFDLNLGTVVVSSELCWAILFAFLIYHEQPKFTELVGSGFILASIIFLNINFKHIFHREKKRLFD